MHACVVFSIWINVECWKLPKLLVKHYKLVGNKYSAAAVLLEPEELSKCFTQIPFCVCGTVGLLSNQPLLSYTSSSQLSTVKSLWFSLNLKTQNVGIINIL